jgi:hypothetical protein
MNAISGTVWLRRGKLKPITEMTFKRWNNENPPGYSGPVEISSELRLSKASQLIE